MGGGPRITASATERKSHNLSTQGIPSLPWGRAIALLVTREGFSYSQNPCSCTSLTSPWDYILGAKLARAGEGLGCQAVAREGSGSHRAPLSTCECMPAHPLLVLAEPETVLGAFPSAPTSCGFALEASLQAELCLLPPLMLLPPGWQDWVLTPHLGTGPHGLNTDAPELSRARWGQTTALPLKLEVMACHESLIRSATRHCEEIYTAPRGHQSFPKQQKQKPPADWGTGTPSSAMSPLGGRAWWGQWS